MIAILSQGVILGLSVISGFILPQKMGPESYGYWQVYMFYLAYINLFGLGYNDGIALFYGGYAFHDLPVNRIRSALRILYGYLAVILAACLAAVFFGVKDAAYRPIYTALVVNIPLSVLQCIVMTVFLAVGRTEIYNLLNVALKALTVVFCLSLIFLHVTDYTWMIRVDLAARVLITAACIYLGRSFLFGKAAPLREGWQELSEKIRGGIQITIALIASMLIPVMGRWIIERFEPIGVYGIYSFAMSLLTIVLSFTNVVGTVLFPFLKQMNPEKMKENYDPFALVCDVLIACALLLYLPLMFLLRAVMVKYLPALSYLHILMAMCLPLGRMQLLLTPYYKACRMEKGFLLSNVLGAAAMAAVLLAAYSIWKTPYAVAVGTTLTLAVWTFAAEIFLTKKTGIGAGREGFVREAVMMLLFIFAGNFHSYAFFSLVYGISVTAMLFFYKNKIFQLIITIRRQR